NEERREEALGASRERASHREGRGPVGPASARRRRLRAHEASWLNRRATKPSPRQRSVVPRSGRSRCPRSLALSRRREVSLEGIRSFQKIIGANDKERALQQRLDHLWTLDPAWERTTEREITE